MVLNAREASNVRTDSVVYLKMPDPGGICGGASHTPFLEIDAGRPASQSITNHAELRGEVTYFAEIGWSRPEPWWRKVTVWIAYLTVIGAIAVVVVLARRRARARRQTKDPGCNLENG